MKYNEGKLWQDFKSSFKSTILSYPTNVLDASWISKEARSKFYFNSLLPEIATKLKLGFKTERPFRVDAIFFEFCSQKTEVPIIYIESENTARTSGEELYKLCCINSPLKILFLCNEWNTHEKNELANKIWHPIISDFAEINLLHGTTCILIAEWLEKLIFYSYCFDNKGFVFEQAKLIEI